HVEDDVGDRTRQAHGRTLSRAGRADHWRPRGDPAILWPMTRRPNLRLLVGAGPAPGINSVIGAATIRSVLEGVRVLGIRDGFHWIMHGDADHVTPLTIDHVSRIHFRGGSHLG